eukprot:7450361-Alexandrium_andersonii.AAC.1
MVDRGERRVGSEADVSSWAGPCSEARGARRVPRRLAPRLVPGLVFVHPGVLEVQGAGAGLVGVRLSSSAGAAIS